MPYGDISLCVWYVLTERCASLAVKQKQSKYLTLEEGRNAEGQEVCKKE